MINGLPKKLQTLRKQYRYSQKQVAQKLNVSPSIVSGYETGERTPSTEILLALSYLYHCSTDYLLGKTSEAPRATIDVTDLTDRQVQALNSLVESIKDA